MFNLVLNSAMNCENIHKKHTGSHLPNFSKQERSSETRRVCAAQVEKIQSSAEISHFSYWFKLKIYTFKEIYTFFTFLDISPKEHHSPKLFKVLPNKSLNSNTFNENPFI